MHPLIKLVMQVVVDQADGYIAIDDISWSDNLCSLQPPDAVYVPPPPSKFLQVLCFACLRERKWLDC